MIDLIEKRIGYHFKNEQFLRQAFVHSSYAKQHNVLDNERMEFLGDAILEYIVSEYIYEKYSRFDDGQLSKVRAQLVSADGLRPVVERMDILRYLLIADNSYSILTQSKKINANLYEAILCAIYLDGGMACAKEFVLRTLSNELSSIKAIAKKDCKSLLQEYCQSKKMSIEYALIGKTGPDNKPSYEVALLINKNRECTGVGGSIKVAEQNAAKKILSKWRID